MTIKNSNLGIIIIAAGNSSRLGVNKQLVEIKGVTLLERSITIAKGLENPLICVLGFEADRIKSQLALNNHDFIINNQWQNGMGSSIACGVNYFDQKPFSSINALMILLCDQYLIKLDDLQKLKAEWDKNNNSKIVASEYYEPKERKTVQGAPAIFPKDYFQQLTELKEKGARKIIQQNQHKLISVPLENAAYDLDTKNDLQKLKTLAINH